MTGLGGCALKNTVPGPPGDVGSHSQAWYVERRLVSWAWVPLTVACCMSVSIGTPASFVVPNGVPWFVIDAVATTWPPQLTWSSVVVCGGHAGSLRPGEFRYASFCHHVKVAVQSAALPLPAPIESSAVP